MDNISPEEILKMKELNGGISYDDPVETDISPDVEPKIEVQSPAEKPEPTIKETVLANHWKQLLIKNLFETDHPIEKTYCLQGWQTTWESSYSRNVQVLCEKLNQAISQVNFDLGPKGYPNIKLKFDLSKIFFYDSLLFKDFTLELRIYIIMTEI